LTANHAKYTNEFPKNFFPPSSNFRRHPLSVRPESGAKATAVQTLARPPGSFKLREASGLRRVHRRFSPTAHPKMISKIRVQSVFHP
jgi:hypothetical protein